MNANVADPKEIGVLSKVQKSLHFDGPITGREGKPLDIRQSVFIKISG